MVRACAVEHNYQRVLFLCIVVLWQVQAVGLLGVVDVGEECKHLRSRIPGLGIAREAAAQKQYKNDLACGGNG